MTEWLLTYLLHSTLVLSFVLLLFHVFSPPAALRDPLLRLALCLPLGTALLSVSVLSPPRVVALITDIVPSSVSESAVSTPIPQRPPVAVARPSVPAHTVIPLPLSGSEGPWALVLLLSGAGWTVVRYGLAWRRLPLRHARPSEDPALQRLLSDVTRHAPLRHVRLLQGPVSGPCALGRHTILIPPDLTNHLTHQQLNAVVAHEYAHLLRRDPAWTVALGVLAHLLWFQPLNWMVLAAWRRASEEQCDAWAARIVSPGHLAHALLRLAQPTSRPAHALLSPSASTSHLTVRITALIRPKESAMPRIPFLLLAGVPFALVAVLPPVALAGSGSPRGIVVLDPGHGGEDAGVVGYAVEKDVTLLLAQQIRRDLTRAGVQVIMTREGDQGLSVLERVRLAVSPANLFLSLHADAAEDETQRGISAYVAAQDASPQQKVSRAFATRLLADITRNTGAPSRGVKEMEYTVLTKAKVPAVLLNVGFATNAGDGGRLTNPADQQRLSASVVRAIQATLQSP